MLDVSSEKLLHSIFRTLAYSDVFDYPLTAGEIHRYLTATKASPEEIDRALAQERPFTPVDNYFTLPGREALVATRKRRLAVAKRLWPKAVRYGRIIARLPFVRMVAVTGSLAMNNTDAGKDIDYMIVTAPGRLWMCRLLSLVVARVARREGVSLCPNYLLTAHALKLDEQSLYVAHELTQMVPLSGMDVYREIFRLNPWVAEYLPNACGQPEMSRSVKLIQTPSLLQRTLEVFLSTPVGNWLEKWEMDRKLTRLRREQSASSESYFSADVCKGHIDRHAEKIETAFAVRNELLQ